MRLKTWRYAALILSALTMALGFCHLMELPARMNWDADLWVGTTVEGGLYVMFGTLGGAIVTLNLLALLVLAIWVWRHPPTVRWLTAAAALLFTLAFILFWIVVAPVNAEFADWTRATVPEDWKSWRLRWELGHAVNTTLQMIGFAALAWSVLEETPPPAKR